MARKNKGIHTSPEKAGEKNFPEGYAEKNQDPTETTSNIMPIWFQGMKNREDYKGLWTEDSLQEEINKYFDYCFTKNVKPSKAGLGIWLGTSKQTIWEWETKPDKYGFKSELIRCAGELIEMSYIDRGEKYPTFNMFLLRSTHGHVEKNKVEVSTTNATTADEVKDAISKLGLDK